MIFKLLQWLVVAFSSASNHSNTIITKVDLIELNHVTFESSLGYSQVILWQWSPNYRRYDCVAWYLVDPNKLHNLPQKIGQRWVARHRDTQNRDLQFHAKIFRETRTPYDPERESSKLLLPKN